MIRREFLLSVASSSLLRSVSSKIEVTNESSEVTTSNFISRWREGEGVLAPQNTVATEFDDYEEWSYATVKAYHPSSYDNPSNVHLFDLRLESLIAGDHGQSWYTHKDIDDFSVMFRHFPEETKHVMNVYNPSNETYIFSSRIEIMWKIQAIHHSIVSEYQEEEENDG